MMCSRPLLRKSSTSCLVDALVVAEDHALQHVADRASAPRRQGARGTRGGAGRRRPGGRRGDRRWRRSAKSASSMHVLPAAPQVPTVVELPRLGIRQRLDAHGGQPQQRALRERPGRIVAEGLPLLEPQTQVGGLAELSPIHAGHPHRQRDLILVGGGQVRQHRRDGDPLTDVGRERGAGDRVEAGAAEHSAGADEEHAEAGGSQHGGAPAESRRARRRREARRRPERRPRPATRAAAARRAPGTAPRSSRRAAGEEARAVARRRLRR